MTGLETLSTLVTPFSHVLDYRTCRPMNKSCTLSAGEAAGMYPYKQRIYVLHPTFGIFTGSPVIRLLSFLATMRDEFHTTGDSEPVLIRVIEYYFEEEALDVHEEKLSSGTDNPEEELFGEIDQCKRRNVADALMRRLITNGFLQKAYKAVTRDSQKEGKNEARFALRLRTSLRLCRHVFRKLDVVNSYIFRFKKSVREIVEYHVRMMKMAERINLEAIRQAAVAIEKSQRALEAGD